MDGTLRELEKGSTDYSTWHVGPEATGEEEGRVQRRGKKVTDACRAYETPAIAIVAIVCPAWLNARTDSQCLKQGF